MLESQSRTLETCIIAQFNKNMSQKLGFGIGTQSTVNSAQSV